MLYTTLRPVGGSVMFAIPKAILEGLDLQANARVGVTVEDGKLVVDPHPRKTRYTLAGLIAELEQPPGGAEENNAWANGIAVGREII